jgi:lipoprotein-anchoring transpeptidase ErfK/SrfK
LPPVAQPAVITAASGDAVNPAKPVAVAIRNGKLTEVTMLNPAGRKVRGAISAEGTSWRNTEDLGYAKTYRITAKGVDAAGGAVTKTATVTTLTPDNMTMPSLQRIGGYPLTDGATYGVAIVPVVHFDEPIANRAAAERSLKVTTSPRVAGSWYWADDQNVHWRPEQYWPSGTTVTVSAKVYGVRVGPGLYGQSDRSTSFKIGRRQVTIAHDSAPKAVNKVRVYNADHQVIRTMNTSMGMHGGQMVNGNWINFYTLDGTYTVLGHEQPARMCSASYGLPSNAPNGYPCENIYNATKISTDGIYLHELLTTVYSQDHGADVSHGCLNLNAPNSMWFFKHSMVGDPVEIRGAKGAPTLQIGQGGDWTIPWSTWVKGSALS